MTQPRSEPGTSGHKTTALTLPQPTKNDDNDGNINDHDYMSLHGQQKRG